MKLEKHYSFKIDEKDLKAIKKAARINDTSQSTWGRHIIREKLREMKLLEKVSNEKK